MANCVEDPFFIPVKSITGVPDTGMTGVPLTLTATVSPDLASNTSVTWLVRNGGSAGASVNGNVLITKKAGTVSILAIVADGMGTGKDYTQDFTIVISGDMPESDDSLEDEDSPPVIGNDLPETDSSLETDDSPFVTTGVIIYRSGGPATAVINLGSSYTNVKWYYDDILLGTESSLTLDSSDPRYNMIGVNYIIVEAWKNGVLCVMNIVFEVRENNDREWGLGNGD